MIFLTVNELNNLLNYITAVNKTTATLKKSVRSRCSIFYTLL